MPHTERKRQSSHRSRADQSRCRSPAARSFQPRSKWCPIRQMHQERCLAPTRRTRSLPTRLGQVATTAPSAPPGIHPRRCQHMGAVHCHALSLVDGRCIAVIDLAVVLQVELYWRRRNCQTEVRGASAVPIDAERKLCGSPAIPSDPNCTIKATTGRKECIYHLEGQRMAHSKCLAETSDGSAQSSKRKRRAAVYRSGKGDHTRSDARANLMKAICSSCSTPSPSQVRQSR